MIGRILALVRRAVSGRGTMANMSIGTTPAYVDALPFARRAIELLGGVQVDKAEWLAAAVVKHRDGARIAEAILADGTLLSNEEVVALGFKRWTKVAREPLDALTPEGRADPLGTLDALARRVLRWLYAEHERRQAADLPGAAVEGYELVPGRAPCALALASRDTLFSSARIPLVPFWECSNGCECRMRIKLKRRRR